MSTKDRDIWSEDTPAIERRDLYMKAYVERGLTHCKGKRVCVAKYLALSKTYIRNMLNRYPDLKEKYPSGYDDRAKEFYKRRGKILSETPEYWLPSKKKEMQEKIDALAIELGVESII